LGISPLGEGRLAWRIALYCQSPRQPALTLAPIMDGDCGKIALSGTKRRPASASFPQIPDRFPTTALPGALRVVVILRLFFVFHHPTVRCSLVRHRADYGSESENRASVSLLPFPHCHGFRFRWVGNALPRTARCLPVCEASSKRQGDGKRFKKKAMKTTTSSEAAAPASVQKSSVSKNSTATQSEFVRHCANRQLSTEAVLNQLRTRLPQQYGLAEVVGKWIWLDVSPASKPGLASVLWALGFHWNARRNVWQHPCGKFDPLGSHPADPRAKYRAYFPADLQPA